MDLEELKSYNVCNKIKLEFKNRKVAEKFPKYLALNNTLLNKTQGNKKSQEKFYNILN